ncbi:IS5/IS1182 family transposase, partial [Lysinibacillus sp. VIII_CA]
MMTKNPSNEREQLEMLTIDPLVPNDHLVRKLEAAIDFSFIYPLVEQLYSPNGRPSIDPVVLFKMTFIQYVFG